jgi:hypothetical protein
MNRILIFVFLSGLLSMFESYHWGLSSLIYNLVFNNLLQDRSNTYSSLLHSQKTTTPGWSHCKCNTVDNETKALHSSGDDGYEVE